MHGPGYEAFFTAGGAVLSLARPGPAAAPSATRDVLSLSFAGANPSPQVEAVGQLPGTSNYFLGSSPSQWRTDVPNYSEIVYHDVYPGVDVDFHGDAQGNLEYDFVVAPGADLSQVHVSWQGARSVASDGAGDLLIQTASGQTLTEKAPALSQTVGGVKKAVSGQGVLNADGTVGFTASGYDPTQPLVVDPALIYSTYLGGSGNDDAYAIAVDPSGAAYVAGSTASTDFPGSPVGGAAAGSGGAFVTKLNPAGTAVEYSAYFGAGVAYGVAVDASGQAVVTGSTGGASNFPTTAGALESYGTASGGGFVAKLSETGDDLVYSTYFGQSGTAPAAVAVDVEGDAFVTGSTSYSSSSFFPTTSGAFQTTFPGGPSAFVAKLGPAGALDYGTFLGGSAGSSFGAGIAVDVAGDAFVAGYTGSASFPTLNAYQSAFGSSTYDAFLTKVNPSGSGLIYSTYFGSGNTVKAAGVAVDAQGDALLGGTGVSVPTTTGAYLTSGTAAFAAKFAPSVATLVYSTYLGGGQVGGVAVDSAGDLDLTGQTAGSTFPTTSGAFQTSPGGGGDDAFVARLNPSGSSLLLGSYLGGSGVDVGTGVAVDPLGNTYVTGYTNSSDFPTTSGAFQTTGHTTSASYDAFVSKVALGPRPGLHLDRPRHRQLQQRPAHRHGQLLHRGHGGRQRHRHPVPGGRRRPGYGHGQLFRPVDLDLLLLVPHAARGRRRLHGDRDDGGRHQRPDGRLAGDGGRDAAGGDADGAGDDRRGAAAADGHGERPQRPGRAGDGDDPGVQLHGHDAALQQ